MVDYMDDELPLPSFVSVFGDGYSAFNKRRKRLSLMGKYDGITSGEETTGRWTPDEHRLFLEGIMLYGRDWKKMQSLIKTRTLVQIRTHAQKVFKKIGLRKLNGTKRADDARGEDLEAVDEQDIAAMANQMIQGAGSAAGNGGKLPTANANATTGGEIPTGESSDGGAGNLLPINSGNTMVNRNSHTTGTGVPGPPPLLADIAALANPPRQPSLLQQQGGVMPDSSGGSSSGAGSATSAQPPLYVSEGMEQRDSLAAPDPHTLPQTTVPSSTSTIHSQPNRQAHGLQALGATNMNNDHRLLQPHHPQLLAYQQQLQMQQQQYQQQRRFDLQYQQQLHGGEAAQLRAPQYQVPGQTNTQQAPYQQPQPFSNQTYSPSSLLGAGATTAQHFAPQHNMSQASQQQFDGFSGFPYAGANTQQLLQQHQLQQLNQYSAGAEPDAAAEGRQVAHPGAADGNNNALRTESVDEPLSTHEAIPSAQTQQVRPSESEHIETQAE